MRSWPSFPALTRAPAPQSPERTGTPTGGPEETAPPAFVVEGGSFCSLVALRAVSGARLLAASQNTLHLTCCSHSNGGLLLPLEACWFRPRCSPRGFVGPALFAWWARSLNFRNRLAYRDCVFPPLLLLPPPFAARQMKRPLPRLSRHLIWPRGLLPQVITGRPVSSGTLRFENRKQTTSCCRFIIASSQDASRCHACCSRGRRCTPRWLVRNLSVAFPHLALCCVVPFAICHDSSSWVPVDLTRPPIQAGPAMTSKSPTPAPTTISATVGLDKYWVRTRRIEHLRRGCCPAVESLTCP